LTAPGTFTETSVVQQPIVDLLTAGGWAHVPGKDLARDIDAVIVESDVRAALLRLNPVIAERPERADEVLTRLRAAMLRAGNDGLVQANEQVLLWARGLVTHRFDGTPAHIPVRLIDFDDLDRNRYVVSDEVSYGAPGHRARFDIVLWVNGLPLVVGETKSPVSAHVSWFNAAKDIAEVYEPGWPQFFTTNVLSFATEGKDFYYGGAGQHVSAWERWGSTTADARLSGWARVKLSVETLLTPRTVLDILDDFTLFESGKVDGVPVTTKIVPRYPQYEAVTAIHGRALEVGRRRGLLHQTQGSGKTLAMVWAAAKLVREPRLKNPTVVMIADRVQLVTQSFRQFTSAGVPSLQVAQSTSHLRSMLSEDRRGVIFTTIHKFAGAGQLTARDNVIVLLDEAHRTTEGMLGAQLAQALPNAAFFGFTGTPIADQDRNTFDLFGDPRDPGHALNTYDSDRAIADGVTVPMHVAARVVRFNIDREELEAEFDFLAETEGLTDEEKDLVAARSGRLATFVANPNRIRTVCRDIVDHFYSTVEPLGMKAQVVVFDRASCVAYERELTRLLAERAAEHGGTPDEAAVVMTVSGKDDADWAEYELSDYEEEQLLTRFRNFHDPLTFLIVTSKLGTGFNAPIEGVMYLDKPLKLHTLFQTITRTNRTWRNPITGQEKRYGLIVDYFGLGDGFARAMAPADPDAARRKLDTDGLLDLFEEELASTLDRFAGIDRTRADFETFNAAKARLPDDGAQSRFAASYLVVEGVWEALYPDVRLERHRDDYRWLSRVYQSTQPSDPAGNVLWAGLGAKTAELVHRHITDLTVDDPGFTAVISDDGTLTGIRAIIELPPPGPDADAETSVGEVVDGIAERIKKRLAGSRSHPAYTSLADRLERLRDAQLTRAADSVDFLKRLFELARDLRATEIAEDTGGTAALDLLPNPHLGALTQIFEEFAPPDAPVIIADIVWDIDHIVGEVSYPGWSETQRGDRLVRIEIRKVLGKYGLPPTGDLFDRAHAYVAEHY